MGQALYRSYRPKKIGEVVGHEHITTALSHALQNGTLSHAYLFTGPRGIGKTTIARILAHEINGLPYEDDSMHLDIIEIDAASNRRIDEIRDLRDKVNLAPTSAKYKVYIIDEVHMLTREAFNALLKTLEEPPAHVVFILATTEMHKLPETIVSRTQHFTFRPVEQPKVVGLLKELATKEKITIDDEALALIAQHGEGSFRDSISLLDQLRNQTGMVTLADVQSTLGIAPEDAVATLLATIQQHDASGVVNQLTELYQRGYEPSQLAKQFGKQIRAQVVAQSPDLEPTIALTLLGQLVGVPASSDPKIALEVALLDATFGGAPTASKSAEVKSTPTAHHAPKAVSEAVVEAKPVAITEPHPSTFQKQTEATQQTPPKVTAPEPAAVADTDAGHAVPGSRVRIPHPQPSTIVEPEAEAVTPGAPPANPVASGDTLTSEDWAQVLAAIKKRYSTLYGIINGAEVQFTPDKLTLVSKFAFHQKRLKEDKNREIIAQTIEEITGQKTQIECIVGEVSTSAAPSLPALPPEDGESVHSVQSVATPSPAPVAATTPPAPPAGDAIATVSHIFGGAELLQS